LPAYFISIAWALIFCSTSLVSIFFQISKMEKRDIALCHQPQHIAALRAQRHPQSEFLVLCRPNNSASHTALQPQRDG